MKTTLSNNNFSVGIVNSSVNGRYDLPIYRNGLEICDNFIIPYEGGLKNRTGTIKLLDTVESYLIPFIFNKEQAYLIQFTTDKKIRFITYSESGIFGYIKSEDNSIYELESPYTLEEARKLQYAQNSDVMYLCYKEYLPKKLIRKSATTFEIKDVVFESASPFTANTGYPSAVCFYENRLFYGGVKNKPTFIYASDVGYHDKFSLTGTDDELDGFTFDLSDASQNINWLFPTQNTLIAGTQSCLLYLDGGNVGQSMTKKSFRSRKASENGNNGSIPIKNNNVAIYIDETERKTRSFTYELTAEQYNTPNLNILNSDFTIGGLKEIKTLNNKNNYIYVLKHDGSLMFVNYLASENINTWTTLHFHNKIIQIQNLPRGYDTFEDLLLLVEEDSKYYICKLADEVEIKNQNDFFTGNLEEDTKTYQRYISEIAKQFNYLDMSKTYSDYYESTITYNKETNIITSTAEDFTENDINKNIVYKSDDGKDYATFRIIKYINSTSVKVESLRSKYSRNTYSKWYKSFGSITITDSYYFNKTVSVVADGGYIGEFEVSDNGFIDFNKQITVATIGFKYTAVAKSLNLGYEMNGINTQITNKNISKVNLRCNNSAGGEFTTNRYETQKIQDFSPNGYYDNIPLLINGDVSINVNDNWSSEKHFYILQTQPLPLNITMITITREDNTQ